MVVEISQMGQALVTGLEKGAPATRRAGQLARFLASVEQGHEPTDAVGHSSDGGGEGVLDHFLGDEVGLVQVVGGDESRWDADP